MIAYQRIILERFMSAEALAKFDQDYKEVKIRPGKVGYEVTDTDRMILIDYKRGMLIRELANKYHTSSAKILNSIRRVALDSVSA